MALDRPVVNPAGLKSEYKVRLDRTPDPDPDARPAAEPAGRTDDDPRPASIFTAIQAALGLRLQAGRVRVKWWRSWR